MALSIDVALLARHVDQVADSIDSPMHGGRTMILRAAADALREAASRQGAPRLALDGTRDCGLRQTDLGDHDTLRALGIGVEVGTLVPSGAAVRLSVDDIARWLDPEEAHRLSIALRIAAEEAMHEDRAGRRG